MSATTNKNLNPLSSNDRVKFNNKEHFLYAEKGTVKSTDGISTHVVMDCSMEIITSFRNLKKYKKK